MVFKGVISNTMYWMQGCRSRAPWIFHEDGTSNPRTWNGTEIVGQSRMALAVGIRGMRGAGGQISRHVTTSVQQKDSSHQPSWRFRYPMPLPHHQVEVTGKENDYRPWCVRDHRGHHRSRRTEEWTEESRKASCKGRHELSLNEQAGRR